MQSRNFYLLFFHCKFLNSVKAISKAKEKVFHMLHCFISIAEEEEENSFHLGLKTLHIGNGKKRHIDEINKFILKFKSKFVHYVYNTKSNETWMNKKREGVEFICTCSLTSRPPL